MKKSLTLHATLSLAAGFFLFAASAQPAGAYAGLGPLVPMIGNGLLLLFMFLITGVGMLAYPIRIMMRKFSKRDKASKK